MQGWMLGKLNLSWSWNMRDVKVNKKHFYRYIHSKKKTKEKYSFVVPQSKGPSDKDSEQVNVVNDFFVLFFTGKIYPQDSQVPVPSGWSSTHSKRDGVRNQLSNLKIHESMRAEWMNFRVGNELTNIAKSLPAIFEHSYTERHFRWFKMENVTPILKKANQLNLTFWEVFGTNSHGNCPGTQKQEGVLGTVSMNLLVQTVPNQPDCFLWWSD